MSLQCKGEHAFRGFKGCYTVITTNYLGYPFNPPQNSQYGIDEEEFQLDKDAMMARTSIVKMEKSFDSDKDQFPFTQEEFANMMLSMHVYEQHYPEFKAPFDINELSPQKTT